MLIWDRITGDFTSREPALLCSFGITEAFGAILASVFAEVGVGAATSGIIGTGLAGAIEGAGVGALSGAVTGGDPGKGALYGGLSGGLLSGGGALIGNLGGGLSAGAGAAGADTGATFADSLTPATAGTSSGIIDAGTFADGAGLSAGAGTGASGFGGINGSAGADTGATFSDSFLPATVGTPSGLVDSGSFDVGTGGASGLSATPSFSSGVTSVGSDGLAANTQALGGPVAAGGSGGGAPGALGSAPPLSVNPAALDPTATAGQSSAFGGAASDASSPLTYGPTSSFSTGSADTFTPTSLGQAPGKDVFSGATTSEPVTPPTSLGSATPAQVQSGDTFSETGPAVTSSENNAVLDSAYDQQNFASTGIDGTGKGWLGRQWDSVTGGVDSLGKAIESPTGKAISTALSVGGLAKSLLTPSNIPGEAQLSQLASSLGSTGTGLIGSNAAASTNVAQHASSQASTLENYLNTGSLPPAVQSSLNQATNSAITNIRAQFAARGMPPGSSAEQQEIAAVRQSAVIQGGTLAAQLYSQGVSLDQLSASIYQNLTGQGASLASAGASALGGVVNTNVTENNAVNTAIANLASSLGGGNNSIKQGQTFVAQAQ